MEKSLPYHESLVVKIPGVGGQTPVDKVHDGVLNDVNRSRHARGEESLCPARHSIGFHQEASRQKPVVISNLPVHNILCENMGAD